MLFTAIVLVFQWFVCFHFVYVIFLLLEQRRSLTLREVSDVNCIYSCYFVFVRSAVKMFSYLQNNREKQQQIMRERREYLRKTSFWQYRCLFFCCNIQKWITVGWFFYTRCANAQYTLLSKNWNLLRDPIRPVNTSLNLHGISHSHFLLRSINIMIPIPTCQT